MASSLRFLTFPEILANMIAHAQSPYALGPNVDVNPGSVLRTILECSSLSDAAQHVQMSKVLNLFSLDKCRGDDLDQRGAEIGSDVLTTLRRNGARQSVTNIVVGNGTALVTTTLAADVTYGATTFTVLTGSFFPVAGACTLSAGTSNQETLIYSRSGNTFTVISSSGAAALQRSHAGGEPVVSTSIQSTLAVAAPVGAGTIMLATGTGAAWSTSGFVILDRGFSNRERLAFTRSGDVLSLPVTTTFAHAIGSIAVQSTSGVDYSVPSGAQCYAPATLTTAQVPFLTTAAGTLYDGDFVSGLIPVLSLNVGAGTRVGSNQITAWTSLPFPNATVTNPGAATGGSDRESDNAYRQRLKNFIQSLTRATPLAITTLVNTLQDPITGARVAFTQIIEPVLVGQNTLYITDGTSSFSLGQTAFNGRDVVISDAVSGAKRGKLGIYGPPYSYSVTAPVSPRLFSSAGTVRGSASSVGYNYLEDTSQAMTTNAFAGMWLKTQDNVFRQIQSNTAVRFILTSNDTPSLGSYSVYNFAGSPLTPGTDFNFNPSTGDVELVTALSLHDGLVAAADGASPSQGAYLYSSGLAAYVQRSVNGDPTDFNDFPGYKAAGVQIVVAVPTIVAQQFVINVIPAAGYTTVQLTQPVQIATETYVNSLGIGSTIVLSEIIGACVALPGVADARILFPPANVVMAAGTMPRIGDINVQVV